MLTTTRRAWLPLLLALIVGVALSQEPASVPAKATQQEKTQTGSAEQRTADDQRATEKTPFVVKIVSANREVKTSENPKEREEKSSAEWWLVAFNGLLVVVVFLQWFWMVRQERWMKANVGVAEKSANAAKESADALAAAERAYLFVEIAIRQPALGSSPSGFRNNIGIKFWNYGKTPAEIVRIRAYAIVQKEVPEALIEFDGSDRELPPGLGIAKDCAFDVPITCTVTDTELGEIERQDKKLFCVGYISYRDIFGDPRETGFCWEVVYHMYNPRFVPSRDSPLNKRT